MTVHNLIDHFVATMNGRGVQREILEDFGDWVYFKVLYAVYIRTSKQRVRDSFRIFDDYMYGVTLIK